MGNKNGIETREKSIKEIVSFCKQNIIFAEYCSNKKL